MSKSSPQDKPAVGLFADESADRLQSHGHPFVIVISFLCYASGSLKWDPVLLDAQARRSPSKHAQPSGVCGFEYVRSSAGHRSLKAFKLWAAAPGGSAVYPHLFWPQLGIVALISIVASRVVFWAP
ncbi:hypothetical protein V8E53_000554 [Lactarius tabidus]